MEENKPINLFAKSDIALISDENKKKRKFEDSEELQYKPYTDEEEEGKDPVSDKTTPNNIHETSTEKAFKYVSFEEVDMLTKLSNENTELLRVKELFNSLSYVMTKKATCDEDEKEEEVDEEEEEYDAKCYFDVSNEYVDKMGRIVQSQIDNLTTDFKMEQSLETNHIINFFVRSLIELEQPANLPVVEEQEKPKTPVKFEKDKESDETMVSTTINFIRKSLLDEYAYFNFSKATEMTHQVPVMDAVLKYCLQAKEKFQFGTLEEIRVESIKSAFDTYSVKPKKTFGDFNVKIKVELAQGISDWVHFLFGECQRDSCTNVFKHKDFIKICIIMRTTLKHIVNLKKKATKSYWEETNVTVYAMLCSKDYIYFIQMSLISNKDKDQLRPIYKLGIIGACSILKQQNAIMACLYHIFNTVNIESSFGGKPVPCFSDTPKEIVLREIEAKHISFEEVRRSSKLCDENTELQMVGQFFKLPFERSKITIFGEELWSQRLENTKQSIYYIHKDTNNFVLVSRGEKHEIAVLTKDEYYADFICCRFYHLQDKNLSERNEKILIPESKKAKSENSRPANSIQQNSTVKDKSIENLCCKTKATTSLVEYLDKNNITCSTKCLVKRSAHSYFGVGLYFCAEYNGEKVFVKLNCYRSFYQNEKGMNFLKNQTAKHVNKIMDFKVTTHSPHDLCGILNIEKSVVDHLQLNGKIYLTVAESLTDWFSILPNMFVSQVPPKPTLSLIVKLMIDFLEGVKELHSMGIVHGDLSIMNCLLKISEDDDFPLNDLTEIKFHGVLADFNSSKLETQHFNSFEYFPITSHAPPDFQDFVQFGIEPKISYTKAHDIYALSFVITQFTLVLFRKRNQLVNNFSLVYQFLYETKNPKNSNWLIEEWDKLENLAPKLFEKSESLIEIFAKLRHVICAMFENPWKVIEDAYFEKQINTIQNLLLKE